MASELRNRIVRPATAEEKARHDQIRKMVEQDVPELKQWARDVAARQKSEVPVGTIFTTEESHVVKAIDDYAAEHSLQNRSAVVREALASLLGIEIAPRNTGH